MIKTNRAFSSYNSNLLIFLRKLRKSIYLKGLKRMSTRLTILQLLKWIFYPIYINLSTFKGDRYPPPPQKIRFSQTFFKDKFSNQTKSIKFCKSHYTEHQKKRAKIGNKLNKSAKFSQQREWNIHFNGEKKLHLPFHLWPKTNKTRELEHEKKESESEGERQKKRGRERETEWERVTERECVSETE